jgi:neutral amino acid transport system permease protein
MTPSYDQAATATLDEAPGTVVGGRGSLSAKQRIAVTVVSLLVLTLCFVALKGAQAALQTTLNGLVTGSYLALAAVGLTFVYGVLRLINFAQGDFLTFGAYMALLLNVTLHVNFVVSELFACLATAVLAMALELGIFRPLRRRGAGTLELILSTIGLAYIIRYSIQFVAGPDLHQLGVNDTSYYTLAHGVTIGRTIALTTVISYALLLLIGVLLRYTRLGKQMRAMADNLELAETSGLDTRRLIILVWAFGGSLAGLAGVFYVASTGGFDPSFGFALLLPLFAAILIGGAGDPYGALAGGVVLGLAEEWSTLFISPAWQTVVGFVVLILVLLIRPQGIFAPASRV